MLSLLSLIKNNKSISSVVIAAVIGLGLLMFWNKIESSIYQEGYNDAVQVYQNKMVEEQNKNTEYLEYKLREVRKNYERQQEEEIERIKSENSVDKDVQTKVKIMKEKVYVKEDCDVVSPDLNRMFNDSIRSINGDKEG